MPDHCPPAYDYTRRHTVSQAPPNTRPQPHHTHPSTMTKLGPQLDPKSTDQQQHIPNINTCMWSQATDVNPLTTWQPCDHVDPG
jgi:hypothetical protein